MIKIKEIKAKTMTPEKKSTAKNDIFAYYIGRPISYLFTVPLLYTSIKPNAISIISMIFVVLSFLFAILNKISYVFVFISWIFIFLWNIFDGVDGNIARYKQIYSKNGSTIDATSGYLAMFFTFLSMGIVASDLHFWFFDDMLINSDIFFCILGAISGFCQIFPRLIHHKLANSTKDYNNVLADRSNYNFVKIVGLNLTSIAGFVQLILLIVVILGFFNIYLFDFFTIFYFLLNMLFCIISVFKVLKN